MLEIDGSRLTIKIRKYATCPYNHQAIAGKIKDMGPVRSLPV
jgi:hypothetical protein